ncbi:hypothetical protein PIROE2DRAFT_16421 [Piromyces sp. E2]|nr:hypothetical protein PIROE2DRAFT_16421 [Piromyces sp. E2]|eukprot:OUM58337.1 hypothetical protein PIROE2DRAFT_16421 [Piromyces sp. E2]
MDNNVSKTEKVPLNFLLNLYKSSDDILPFLLQFDKYGHNDILKEVKKNTFSGIEDVYDLLQFYIDDIKYLKEIDFFKKSRHALTDLLKIGEYDKYINFLFFIKLYLYYLKIKIRNIILLEYLIQYRKKYSKEEYVERVRTDNVKDLLKNVKDNTLLEHYLYELMVKDFPQPENIPYNEIKENEEVEQDALDSFIMKDNIKWLKDYWKYIEKTEIYKEMGKESFMEWQPITYIKHKVEIDSILAEAFYLEDIRNDNSFIFNKVNKLKYIKVYKLGYTNSVLKEIDFILNNIRNRKVLEESYDLSNLYNIHYYKTILNIDYFTFNIFKSVTRYKLNKKLINVKSNNVENHMRCPFRKKTKYYISEKYEIPFTNINNTYRNNPDEYIIAYVNQLKYYINMMSENLEIKTKSINISHLQESNIQNHSNKNKMKKLRLSFINNQYMKIIDDMSNSMFNDKIISSNYNEDEKRFFEDEFFTFFIVKLVKFIFSPKIDHIFSKLNYENEKIDLTLENDKSNKPQNPFLYKEKILSRYHEHLFGLSSCQKKINEKSYELENITANDIYSFNLNYFYFDYSLLTDLYILCQKNNRDNGNDKPYSETKNSKLIDLSLVKHIFQNNVNLFFSYIYNIFSDIFQNDYICNANYTIKDFNFLTGLEFMHVLYDEENSYYFKFISDIHYIHRKRKMGFTEISDNENESNNSSCESDTLSSCSSDCSSKNSLETEKDKNFINRLKDYDYGFIYDFFTNRITFYDEIYKTKNEKKYQLLFKHLISHIVKFYDSIDLIKFYKKNYNVKNFDIKSIFLSDNDDYKNNKDSSYKNNKLVNTNIKLFETPENNLILAICEKINNNFKFKQNIYILFKLLRSLNKYDMREWFLYKKIRKAFYEKYSGLFNKIYYISEFNYTRFTTLTNEVEKLKFFRKHLRMFNKNNRIPSLNIKFKYCDSFIKFLELIINYFDKIINYKYYKVKISSKIDDGVINNNGDYGNYFNIKLTNNEDFEINNNNKHFFLLIFSIYLLNAEYLNNYLYNTIDNFNYCQYNEMAKENKLNIVRWLLWNNFETYFYNTREEKEIIDNTKIMDNLLYLNLKDFYNFDSYTNINQQLLPSFFYFLNENNLHNVY